MAFSLSQPEARRLADEVIRGQLALDPLIDEARAGRDVDRTAALLLVRTAAGKPPSTEEVAPLLADAAMEAFLPLLAAAQGDRIALALDAVERDKMSNEREALAILAVTQLLDGKEPPARLAAQLRRCARDCVSDEALACVEAAADALGDPDVLAVVEARSEFAPLETVRRLVRRTREVLADPLAGLSEETSRVVASGFTARRVQPKAGRNDPCPCGSGKKYKKCCMARDEPQVPSLLAAPDAPPKYAPLLDRLSPDEIARMALPELAALDLTSLPGPALEKAFHRLAAFHRFDAAERALALIDQAGHKDVDSLRVMLIGDALHAGDLERAEKLTAQVKSPDALVPSDRLSIALLRKDPAALEVIEQLARDGLADERSPLLIELAYALIDRLPALGILVGRGAVTAKRRQDSETLLDEMERARDRLGIAPWDAAGEAFDAEVAAAGGQPREEPPPPDDLAQREQEAAAMRERLARANQRMAEYERILHEQEQRMAATQVAAAAPAPDSDETRRLRAKVTELKGQIAEGNRERSELRHELQRASSQGAATEVRREPARPTPSEEPDDLGAAVDAPREPLVPDFTAALAAGMGALPARVVRAVVQRVGDAAAGDPSAWRQIKQMNDVEPPLLSLRVGLHHRALMRIAAGTLTVHEVVTREDFDTALKRYRR